MHETKKTIIVALRFGWLVGLGLGLGLGLAMVVSGLHILIVILIVFYLSLIHI